MNQNTEPESGSEAEVLSPEEIREGEPLPGVAGAEPSKNDRKAAAK